MAKRNKYGSRKTTVFGIRFDSKREAERYLLLKHRQQIGEIRGLTLQPAFPCVVNGQKVCVYRADFSFVETATGQRIVEDAKGVRTPVYRIKKKLVKALYGIEIKEV